MFFGLPERFLLLHHGYPLQEIMKSIVLSGQGFATARPACRRGIFLDGRVFWKEDFGRHLPRSRAELFFLELQCLQIIVTRTLFADISY